MAILALVMLRGVKSGPQVEGVESMPPEVRKAFMGAHKGAPETPPKR
ncbi:hypothetical protein [Fimbriimonas ginsengisoli]|uniref:Uncharacterized protein n=1 Tax=Fimbriimonas ginsengisoli Gsoil 348 TaxID=661478 RepID=A0A068NQ47_FIMGI|nr:hypothetical protein [Fimbriimonas ginsengisoli]AIE83729.1 hypothetical protein OP10G_0361 [Fimbriimonas ginsengisoli Gsoil 348]